MAKYKNCNDSGWQDLLFARLLLKQSLSLKIFARSFVVSLIFQKIKICKIPEIFVNHKIFLQNMQFYTENCNI